MNSSFSCKSCDKKYKQLLRKLDIQEEIFDRYVDDETEGLAAIDPGVRFEGGKLVRNEEKIEEGTPTQFLALICLH